MKFAIVSILVLCAIVAGVMCVDMPPLHQKIIDRIHQIEKHYVDLDAQMVMPQAIKTACAKIENNETLTPSEYIQTLKAISESRVE